jgi:hypothetical protein
MLSIIDRKIVYSVRNSMLGLSTISLSLAGCGMEDTAGPPSAAQTAPLADPSAANTIMVTNAEQLVAAVNGGAEGDRISLAAGTYLLNGAL